jgi:hypothetical protein
MAVDYFQVLFGCIFLGLRNVTNTAGRKITYFREGSRSNLV